MNFLKKSQKSTYSDFEKFEICLRLFLSFLWVNAKNWNFELFLLRYLKNLHPEFLEIQKIEKI
jgi:hypothetical protein